MQLISLLRSTLLEYHTQLECYHGADRGLKVRDTHTQRLRVKEYDEDGGQKDEKPSRDRHDVQRKWSVPEHVGLRKSE